MGKENPTSLGGSQWFFGVGVDHNKRHGSFTMTDQGQAMRRASMDPDDRSGVINLIRARSISSYIIGGLELAESTSVSRGSDWRELGLRVCLYDDLREKRFTQPTGTDWAVATKRETHIHYIPTAGTASWGFEATVVN